MRNAIIRRATLTFALLAVAAFAACHKAKVASTTPPPPPPAAPSASLTAEPQAIEKGQSTTLNWQTANATQVSIDAGEVTTESLGAVDPTGSQQVRPSESTTYTLYAKGPGGTETASVRVTVNVPPPAPAAAPAQPTDEELFATNVKDIYFDYDNAQIRSDQQSAILGDAGFLTQHPNIAFTVEGHCDERGSIEYNLALGDERASSVKEALVSAGVNPANINTISFGKEKPVCDEHDESCWHQNRRGHFGYGKQ